MFKWIAILFALSPVYLQAAETLSKDDLIGSWFQEATQYSNSEITLIVSPDLSGTVIRITKSGSTQNCIFKASESVIVDDIFIIKCHRKPEGLYKFVLSGWRSKNKRLLFGKMFMYDKNHLYNGMSVSFVGQ